MPEFQDRAPRRKQALKRSAAVLLLLAGTFDGVALVGTVALGVAVADGNGTWPPFLAAAVATIFLAMILVSIERRVARSRRVDP